MQTIVIVVADDEPGLEAVAQNYDLSLIDGTAHAFDGLDTFRDPNLGPVGTIRTDQTGWIALATAN